MLQNAPLKQGQRLQPLPTNLLCMMFQTIHVLTHGCSGACMTYCGVIVNAALNSRPRTRGIYQDVLYLRKAGWHYLNDNNYV